MPGKIRYIECYSAQAGFTYIEVLLAVAIVAYVSLGFTETMLTSIQSSKMSEYKTLAYNKAVNWIENNRKDYDAAVLSTTTYASYATAETGNLVSGMPYTLEQQVSLSTLGDNGKYKTIDVRINWTERGQARQISYSTIKAKYD